MAALALFSLQYKRQDAVPLDIDQVFGTTASRLAYLTSPRRYAGMLVSDLENQKVYCLNAARDSWILISISSIDQLTDVDTTTITPTSDSVLMWNGSNWIPSAYDLKPRPLAVVPISGSSFNIGSAAHHNSSFRTTLGTAVTITVPNDSFWTGSDQWYTNHAAPTNPGPMPTGGTLVVGKHGAGDVTFVAASGVVINCPKTLVVSSLHGKVTLMKSGPNLWDLEGNLA